jgi:hypothetical protein
MEAAPAAESDPGHRHVLRHACLAISTSVPRSSSMAPSSGQSPNLLIFIFLGNNACRFVSSVSVIFYEFPALGIFLFVELLLLTVVTAPTHHCVLGVGNILLRCGPHSAGEIP